MSILVVENLSHSFGGRVIFEEGMKDGTLQFVHPKYYADILISGILTLVEEKEAGDDEIKDIIIDLIERSGKDQKCQKTKKKILQKDSIH